jgi:hypothetical protein
MISGLNYIIKNHLLIAKDQKIKMIRIYKQSMSFASF